MLSGDSREHLRQQIEVLRKGLGALSLVTHAANNCVIDYYVDCKLVKKRVRDSTGVKPARTGLREKRKREVVVSSPPPPISVTNSFVKPVVKRTTARNRTVASLRRAVHASRDRRAMEASLLSLATKLRPHVDADTPDRVDPIALARQRIAIRKGWSVS